MSIIDRIRQMEQSLAPSSCEACGFPLPTSIAVTRKWRANHKVVFTNIGGTARSTHPPCEKCGRSYPFNFAPITFDGDQSIKLTPS